MTKQPESVLDSGEFPEESLRLLVGYHGTLRSEWDVPNTKEIHEGVERLVESAFQFVAKDFGCG
jgi:hypothetical protein